MKSRITMAQKRTPLKAAAQEARTRSLVHWSEVPLGNSSKTMWSSTTSSISSPLLNADSSSSDLWVGELSSPVPASIATYSIADPVPANSVAIQVGQDDFSDFRVGQNLLDAALTNVVLANGAVNPSDFLYYVDNSTAGGLNAESGNALDVSPFSDLAYETFFETGDSGAPSFVDTGNGSLSLVGIHSFTFEVDLVGASEADRRGSADVWVANYEDQLLTQIAGTPTAVPEPSAFLFVLVAVLSFGLRRRYVLAAD